jgi:putative ATPase
VKPFAYRIRPKTFDDIIGQEHLVGKKGVITKMLGNKTLFSMILYGPAGCGKTSIASIIESYYPLSSFSFNAIIDSKQKLKEIADATKFYESTICIIDEIHRMKKDVQDFLLPYVESGALTIIGLTSIALILQMHQEYYLLLNLHVMLQHYQLRTQSQLHIPFFHP